MKRWKIVEADPEDQDALTSMELISMSVVLNLDSSSEGTSSRKAYWKIQPVVGLAFQEDYHNDPL